MKAFLFSMCISSIVLLNGPNCIAQMSWKSPWALDDSVNLSVLINNGYQIISTNVVYVSQNQYTIEYIYLQKGNDLYKCVTMLDVITREKQHGCEKLIQAARRR